MREEADRDQDHIDENAQRKVEHDPTKIDFHAEDLKKVPKTLLGFVSSTLSIKEDVDIPGTISDIKNEIEFKGHNVWVLMFSILVASIGLDANSVAVVIGAMLISPLMGPIKGVGMSVGTNDFKLLMKSLVNFGVMVGISLLVSWLYFVISPFKEPSAEILARTQPDFRDALIALFGGFAGIIAATQKGQAFTVISGVAIATALMPPLCSAGFMMANGEFSLMFNTLYLFLINSILICLASIIVIRYLKFPLVEFINPKTERKVKIYIGIFMLVVLIPSVYKFYYVMKENNFQRSVKDFIANEVEDYGGAKLKNWDVEYMRGDTVNVIHIEFREDGFLPQATIDEWQRRLSKYDLDPDKTIIDIDDGNLKKESKAFTYEDRVLLDERHRSEKQELNEKIDLKEKIIDQQERQLKAYKDITQTKIKKLGKEIEINYPEVKDFTYSLGFEYRGEKVDTVSVFTLSWDETIPDSIIQERSNRLKQWLKADLDRTDIKIIELNHGKQEEQEEEDRRSLFDQP